MAEKIRNKLLQNQVGVIVVDMQESLLPNIERAQEITESICFLLKSLQNFSIPVIVTEQSPDKLGGTVAGIKGLLSSYQQPLAKTAFSVLGYDKIKEKINNTSVSQWILVGIEAHICILQSARDLLNNGKEVIIANDAISSFSIYDYSTAIAEMRDCGARISSVETILFDLLGSSSHPSFGPVMQGIKDYRVASTESLACKVPAF